MRTKVLSAIIYSCLSGILSRFLGLIIYSGEVGIEFNSTTTTLIKSSAFKCHHSDKYYTKQLSNNVYLNTNLIRHVNVYNSIHLLFSI